MSDGTSSSARVSFNDMTFWSDVLGITVFTGNIQLVELLLRVILGNPAIRIKSVKVQVRIENPGARGLILDILAEGTDGTIYNLEIQQRMRDSPPERARFHEALLTKKALDPGTAFDELKDVYVIFLV